MILAVFFHFILRLPTFYTPTYYFNTLVLTLCAITCGNNKELLKVARHSTELEPPCHGDNAHTLCRGW